MPDPDADRIPAHGDLKFLPLLRERLVVAVGDSHRLAARRRVRLEEFQEEQLILWDREWLPPLYDEILKGCRERGFSPRILHHGLLLMARQALIAAELGFAVEPRSFWSPIGGITLLEISPPATGVTYYMAYRLDDDSPLLRAARRGRTPRRARLAAGGPGRARRDSLALI